MDKDPFLLNVQNGVIDLREIDETTQTCKLRDHDPKFLLTRIAKVAYVPTAACPTWAEFCTSSTDGDRDLEAYRRRRRGSYLSGSPDKVFEIAFGTGDTGKTTYYQTIARVMGSYGQKVPRTIFERQRSEQHPADLMELEGVRFVFGAEIEGSIDIKKVKDITGERTIKARGMRENWQTLERRYKVAIFANDKPQIRRTNNDPIWNRIHADRWSAVITEKKSEAEIDAVYEREGEGILADMVRGWIEYRRMGLAPPKTIMDVTREYRNDEDPIEAWLDQCCDATDPTVETPFSILAESRKRWLEANDPDRKESPKALAALLEARGFIGKKDTKTRDAVRVGIRLRDRAHEAVAPKTSETMIIDEEGDDIAEFLDRIARTAKTNGVDLDRARPDLLEVV
jgi:putative DNA primase/helicase